jgi:MraZ protein
VTLDEKKVMTLPQSILKQLGSCDMVLVSPGSDKCLWLTNQAHLDRLAHKLEKSPARESDKNGFKRLYYAQTVKVPMKDGRVAITDKLAAFAGLDQEVVLVGIDDHFEVWDAARWRRYTQAKKAPTMEE